MGASESKEHRGVVGVEGGSESTEHRGVVGVDGGL